MVEEGLTFYDIENGYSGDSVLALLQHRTRVDYDRSTKTVPD
jgi:hypothetical protein